MTAHAAAARSVPPGARQRNLTQPTSAAQPGSQGRSDRTRLSRPRSGALDGPAKRSYTPTNHAPATPPERWVERVARSIKASDTVVDDGRGIPVAKMEKEGKSALEVVLTVVHAGGKFGEGGGYKVSGGLHGVGVSVVNALSDELTVTVKRDGYHWIQSYVRGIPQGEMQQGEPTEETGTTITFRP